VGVRQPRQKRGQVSWERLLDAAEELLADAGLDGFTTAELSRRSGISNGAIYWRVSSMDALFVAVHERFLQRVAEEHAPLEDAGAWKDLAVEELVERAVRLEAAVFERHPGMLRALALRTATDPAAAERGAEGVRTAGARFAARVGGRLAEAGCDDADVVAASIFRTVFGTLIARVTWPEQQGEPEIPWARFVDDIATMAGAYATRACARAAQP